MERLAPTRPSGVAFSANGPLYDGLRRVMWDRTLIKMRGDGYARNGGHANGRPRRRLAEADTDVVVGRVLIVVPDSGPADFDVLEAFRQRRAPEPHHVPPILSLTIRRWPPFGRGMVDHAAGETTPAANTRRAQAEVARNTERARRESPDVNRALRMNAADALSLGFADEIAGLGNVGSQLVSGADVDVGNAYRAGRNEYRRDPENLSAGSLGRPAPGSLSAISDRWRPIPGPFGALDRALRLRAESGRGAVWRHLRSHVRAWA